MSSEKNEDQEQPKSILDVRARIKEGAHAIYLALGAMAIVAVTWVLYITGAASQGFLLTVIVIVFIAWAVMSNVDFGVREWLLSDVEKRRSDTAQQYTPDTNATDQVMGLSLDEPDDRDRS